jgi:hypothetical protein
MMTEAPKFAFEPYGAQRGMYVLRGSWPGVLDLARNICERELPGRPSRRIMPAWMQQTLPKGKVTGWPGVLVASADTHKVRHALTQLGCKEVGTR